MTQEKNIELAKLLYESYCMGVGGVAFNGDKLPSPEEFFNDPTKEKQAQAWRSTAAASNTFFEINPECITDGALRQKADKWDYLGNEIYSFYFDKNDVEWPQDKYDLTDIGEAAASAYGHL